MMKIALLGILAASAALAQHVEVEFDRQADFTRFKTFSIREGRLTSKDPMLNSELVRKRLDSEIRKALEAKGLALSSSGPADLTVRYIFGSSVKREAEPVPAGPRGRGMRMRRVPYVQGVLTIDLRDSGARSLVWRGVAREQRREAVQLEAKLADMVRKSFEKYPPKPK